VTSEDILLTEQVVEKENPCTRRDFICPSVRAKVSRKRISYLIIDRIKSRGLGQGEGSGVKDIPLTGRNYT
jgi:hypothetical protein